MMPSKQEAVAELLGELDRFLKCVGCGDVINVETRPSFSSGIYKGGGLLA